MSSAEKKDVETEACSATPARVAESEKGRESIDFLQLAQQLEEYFAPQNLEQDTYLQTLMNLNDGYVPANILSDYAKVKKLVPNVDERTNAVVKAASEYSNVLQVVAINPSTGKKVSKHKSKTILAIGLVEKGS